MPPVPERLTWAVALLDARPDAHVLEIGCGGGHALALLAERTRRGTVTGIDRSATAVARARVVNAETVAAGRVRLVEGAFERISLGRRFDAVLAVNVNAFWTTPERSVPALLALLAPGGRWCLAYEPPSEAKARALEAELPAVLARHGCMVEAVQAARFARSWGVAAVGGA